MPDSAGATGLGDGRKRFRKEGTILGLAPLESGSASGFTGIAVGLAAGSGDFDGCGFGDALDDSTGGSATGLVGLAVGFGPPVTCGFGDSTSGFTGVSLVPDADSGVFDGCGLGDSLTAGEG